MTLYKYRDVSNLARALDIIINKRVFASRFSELNDPMEGCFRHPPKRIPAEELWRIRDDKLNLRIASFSSTYRSTLMWTYYAGGHSGICIGLSIPQAKTHQLVKVTYGASLNISGLTGREAVDILSRKLGVWKHEKEHRVLLSDRPSSRGRAATASVYVPVAIEEIIFGLAVDENVKKIVEAVAEAHCPKVKFRNISEDDLS